MVSKRVINIAEALLREQNEKENHVPYCMSVDTDFQTVLSKKYTKHSAELPVEILRIICPEVLQEDRLVSESLRDLVLETGGNWCLTGRVVNGYFVSGDIVVEVGHKDKSANGVSILLLYQDSVKFMFSDDDFDHYENISELRAKEDVYSAKQIDYKDIIVPVHVTGAIKSMYTYIDVNLCALLHSYKLAKALKE